MAALLAACASPESVTAPPPRATAGLQPPQTAPALPPADPAAVDWAEANRTVQALKGHAGHLRTPRAAPVPRSPEERKEPQEPKEPGR